MSESPPRPPGSPGADNESQQRRAGSPGWGKQFWQAFKRRMAEEGIIISVNGLETLKEADLGLDIGLDLGDDLNIEVERGSGGVKVVCVSPDLEESAKKMNESPRDQVVMVRVDAETRDQLDSWVETGAVKSRSEAAALFIREGLEVRADELGHLRDALREVEDAKDRLRQKAREVFGGQNAAGEATEPA